MTAEQFWKPLAVMPSTNARIAVTLVAVVAITARVVVSQDWAPPLEMLGFLLALAGVDAVQFIGKRVTAAEYQVAKQAPALAAEAPPQPKPEVGT